MHIASSSLLDSTALYSSAAAKAASQNATLTASDPERFLTTSDVQMLEYITGTSSLAAAEADPHALKIAQTLGEQRQDGSVTGNVSSSYMAYDLTPSDAKLIEGMTGTKNIIDAQTSGYPGIMDLIINIGLDRQYGAVKGDLTPSYFNDLISFDRQQERQYSGLGISVPLGTAQQALAYLQKELNTDTDQPSTASYSATA